MIKSDSKNIWKVTFQFFFFLHFYSSKISEKHWKYHSFYKNIKQQLFNINNNENLVPMYIIGGLNYYVLASKI